MVFLARVENRARLPPVLLPTYAQTRHVFRNGDERKMKLRYRVPPNGREIFTVGGFSIPLYQPVRCSPVRVFLLILFTAY